MGRATRWLKSLLGIKTANNKSSQPNNTSWYGSSTDRKKLIHNHKAPENGGWICHNPETIPPNITPEEAAWLKSCFPDSPEDNERSSKHAIAVAAATAAAADAAVAAAKAAAEVVRLTSKGRRDNSSNSGGGVAVAAVKIQTTFRGYLARKALRALKGLVKIQALVRGYLVRKQATATFQGMQALIRAQASVRTKRSAQARFLRNGNNSSMDPTRHSMDDSVSEHSSNPSSSVHHSRRLSASTIINNPIPSLDENNSDPDPKVVEVDTGRPRPRSRSSSSPSQQRRGGAYRQHISMSELGEDPSSYQSLLPPHLDYQFQQQHSRFQPNRLSVPTPHHHPHHCCRHHPEAEEDDEYYYAYGPSPTHYHHPTTTQRRFSRYGGNNGPPPPPGMTMVPPSGIGMSSPARTRKASHDDDVVSLHEAWPPGKYYHQYYGNYNNHPSYMTNTQSFKAKSRSHSAPRQRAHHPAAVPGWGGYSYRFTGISHSATIGTNSNSNSNSNSKRRMHQVIINQGRTSLTGVGTCSQPQQTVVVDFKNAVMGRLGSTNP